MENEVKEAAINEELVDASEFVIPSDPKFYEISYIIKPGLDEAGLARAIDALRSAISNLNGIMVEESVAAARRLTFKIKKMSEGHQGWIKFMLKPDQMAPLKKQLEKIQEVLRLSIAKVKKESSIAIKRRAIRKTAQETPAASTEEIDKKLEELLG